MAVRGSVRYKVEAKSSSVAGMLNDNPGGLSEILRPEIRQLFQRFIVVVVDEHGPAPRRLAAIDVPPAISHHPTASEVDVQCLRRREQHSGLRFAAVTFHGAARVVANLDAIDWQRGAHVRVHFFDDRLRLFAATHVGLIGGYNEEKAGQLQSRARFGNTGENLEFGNRGGCVGLAVTDERAIDHAIAVEKNGAMNRGLLWLAHGRGEGEMSNDRCPISKELSITNGRQRQRKNESLEFVIP